METLHNMSPYTQPSKNEMASASQVKSRDIRTNQIRGLNPSKPKSLGRSIRKSDWLDHRHKNFGPVSLSEHSNSSV